MFCLPLWLLLLFLLSWLLFFSFILSVGFLKICDICLHLIFSPSKIVSSLASTMHIEGWITCLCSPISQPNKTKLIIFLKMYWMFSTGNSSQPDTYVIFFNFCSSYFLPFKKSKLQDVSSSLPMSFSILRPYYYTHSFNKYLQNTYLNLCLDYISLILLQSMPNMELISFTKNYFKYVLTSIEKNNW